MNWPFCLSLSLASIVLIKERPTVYPDEIVPTCGLPQVDYRKSDRKVKQITMKYNLMRLRCGLPLLHYQLMHLRCELPFTLSVDDFKVWAPLYTIS